MWADIWTNVDLAKIDSDANQSLANFLSYRKAELLAIHPHDNAHLIT